MTRSGMILTLVATVGCGKKGGADLEKLRDQACACRDAACVAEVGDKMTALERSIKEPTAAQEKLGDEIEQCMKKALTGGAITPAAAKRPASPPQVKCDPARDTLKHDNGNIQRCYPLEEVQVGDLRCRAGGYYVELFPGGNLQGCTLSEGLRVDTNVGKCTGDIQLYESGAIASCYFDGASREVSGVNCAGSADFHEDGSLRRCRVAAAGKVGAIELPKDAWVTLDQGAVSRLELGYDDAKDLTYTWKDYRCVETFFHANGNVRICKTADKMKIRGETAPIAVHLCFDEDGSPAKQPPSAECVDWDKILPDR